MTSHLDTFKLNFHSLLLGLLSIILPFFTRFNFAYVMNPALITEYFVDKIVFSFQLITGCFLLLSFTLAFWNFPKLRIAFDSFVLLLEFFIVFSLSIAFWYRVSTIGPIIYTLSVIIFIDRLFSISYIAISSRSKSAVTNLTDVGKEYEVEKT